MDGKAVLGQLTIPSILFRGHGLNETVCRERVEYAWLMDIDVGCIEGAMATEQVRLLNISMHVYMYVFSMGYIVSCVVCNMSISTEPLMMHVYSLVTNHIRGFSCATISNNISATLLVCINRNLCLVT